jgi:hypothetical protein
MGSVNFGGITPWRSTRELKNILGFTASMVETKF